ncbi:single-stranded-DNA-specific exonuclease RecJ, partial [Parageobacillus sp. SY1]
VETIRRIGADQSHLKAVFAQNGAAIDSVGFGFGYLCDEIAPDAKVSVVGELMVNEWNNLRKPQLMICDVAVHECQLYDIRGMRDVRPLIASLPKDKRMLIMFREGTADALGLEAYKEEIYYTASVEEASRLCLDNRYVVLLDMPTSLEIIKMLLRSSLPARIYALFYQRETHFFRTLPTRDHFKWFYAFLRKKGVFNLAKYGGELARARGWTEETVRFMAKVFLELEFITQQDGVVSLVPQPAKRDLSESPTYRFKQAQFELENLFLYSTYEQLKRCLFEMKGSQTYEEANV